MKRGKAVLYVNILLVVLEIVAMIHNIAVFGAGLFKWYTIDSNGLQLIVSALIVWYLVKKKRVPAFVTWMHIISAVALTITFIIAAFVLAPQDGFVYYFVANVAPINHAIAPLLSVISFLFLEKVEKEPRRIIFLPMAATLIYGVICLLLNMAGLLEGPYFFLKVHETAPATIGLWFGIIAMLCLVLGGVYYKVKWRTGR